MYTVSVAIPHVNPRSFTSKRVDSKCTDAFEVNVETEKEEGPEPYMYTEDYGTKCESCGHVWSPEERREIEKLAIEAAAQAEKDDFDEEMLDLDDDDDDDIDDDDDLDFDDDDEDDDFDPDLDEGDDDPNMVDDELENPRERIKNDRDMFRYE